ncbi:copper resistance CopC family protein [Actinoplanes sp. M2I2]|uniref:copper resistance CopC family protein n=1 Tax=Actinoplanes sp. M2I2 TaxID=1734444 RepID=UPI00202206DD|nr:copper resistance CopC family protein [Actinoplanes sp. M2I2]
MRPEATSRRNRWLGGPRWIQRLLVAAAAFLVVALPGVPAWAHAQLASAVPAPDAALSTAPAAVTLTFNEQLNPEFTTIVVSDAGRQRVPASAPAVSGAAGTVRIEGALGEGAYTVAYRVVSTDGHTIQGSYGFTVGDAARPPVAAGESSGGLPVGVLIGIGAVGLGLAMVAGYLYFSGRRRQRGSA